MHFTLLQEYYYLPAFLRIHLLLALLARKLDKTGVECHMLRHKTVTLCNLPALSDVSSGGGLGSLYTDLGGVVTLP